MYHKGLNKENGLYVLKQRIKWLVFSIILYHQDIDHRQRTNNSALTVKNANRIEMITVRNDYHLLNDNDSDCK